MELGEYTLFPVKAGTILIDASLCEEETSTGRLRFTEAHELSHWILHKGLYVGTGESAALQPAVKETSMEIQANMLRARPADAHANGKAVFLPNAVRPG